jgi:hypothetical protein
MPPVCGRTARACGNEVLTGMESPAKIFTGPMFRGSVNSFFNHLGDLLSVGIGFAKLNPAGNRDGFSVYYSPLGVTPGS